jgi:hypothetical protein
MIGNWYGIEFPRIIAKLLQNYLINNFISLVIHQYFCTNPAIAGLQENGGGKGGTAVQS